MPENSISLDTFQYFHSCILMTFIFWSFISLSAVLICLLVVVRGLFMRNTDISAHIP